MYIMGGQPLQGDIVIGGSKNDSVALMAGALLVPGKTVLRNVPRIGDVFTLIEILQSLGADVRFRADDALEIDATALRSHVTPHDLVRRMRASFNVLGALLARQGHAAVAVPGGCDIGARPVNFHVKGLEQLGCHLRLEQGVYYGEVKRFIGANICLDFPSAGTTQHLMIAGCLARGRTVIENCAVEPEVTNLAVFLNACGAKIMGAGTSSIVIEGVEELHPTEFCVLPDRMQAGTYAVAAAITGGDVTLRGSNPEHCRPVLAKLADAGIDVVKERTGIRIRAGGRRPMATNIKTMPHPGFPTDLQQPFVSFLALAQGVSLVTETIYESRFRYITMLERMGADIRIEGRTAMIRGVDCLVGAPVTCTELRGGAALVVAGLAADGESEISGLEFLDRGYEDMTAKLSSLGAQVSRSRESVVAGGLRMCSV